jgi:hypothetical protein
MTQILTVSFNPCFFIDEEDLYEIYDDFPKTLGAVWEEEITILLPYLVRQILAVIEDEKSNSSPLR